MKTRPRPALSNQCQPHIERQDLSCDGTLLLSQAIARKIRVDCDMRCVAGRRCCEPRCTFRANGGQIGPPHLVLSSSHRLTRVLGLTVFWALLMRVGDSVRWRSASRAFCCRIISFRIEADGTWRASKSSVQPKAQHHSAETLLIGVALYTTSIVSPIPNLNTPAGSPVGVPSIDI